MNEVQTWQVLLVSVTGSINRHRQDLSAHIREENRIPKSKLEGRRIHLTDDERRSSAVKGKAPGRKILGEAA